MTLEAAQERMRKERYERNAEQLQAKVERRGMEADSDDGASERSAGDGAAPASTSTSTSADRPVPERAASSSAQEPYTSRFSYRGAVDATPARASLADGAATDDGHTEGPGAGTAGGPKAQQTPPQTAVAAERPPKPATAGRALPPGWRSATSKRTGKPYCPGAAIIPPGGGVHLLPGPP